MKFHIIPIVNFQKKSNLSYKKPLHPYSLINQTVLFKNLLKTVSFDVNLNQCRKQFRTDQLSASLYFDNYKFRKQYSDWIYSHYSDSTANHQRVHRSEAATLIKGVKQFNKRSHYLKFVQITPDVDDSHLWAKLRLSGMTLTNHTLSFKIEKVMEDKYHLDKAEAFYQFEKQIGQYVVGAFQNYFKQCIPDFPFSFGEAYFNIDDISNLKPLKSVKKTKLPDHKNKSEKTVSSKGAENRSASVTSNLAKSSKASSLSISPKSSSSDVSNSSSTNSSSSGFTSFSSSVQSSSNSVRNSSNVSEESSSTSSISMEWSSANDLISLIKVVAKDVNKSESKSSVVSSSASLSDNNKNKSDSDGLSSKNVATDVNSSLDSKSSFSQAASSQSMDRSSKASSSVSKSQKTSQSKAFGHVRINKESQSESSVHASGSQAVNSLTAKVGKSSQSGHTIKQSSAKNSPSSSNGSTTSDDSSSSENAVNNKSASASSSSSNNSLVSHLIASSEVKTGNDHSGHHILWALVIIVAVIIIIIAIVIGLKFV